MKSATPHNEKLTTFGDVCTAIRHKLDLSQLQLAILVNYSEAAISRVFNGRRPLTPKLAELLGEKVCGTTEVWLDTYEATKDHGSEKSVDFFIDKLLQRNVDENFPGAQIRRLRREEIVKVFGNSSGRMEFFGRNEACEIDPFFPESVKETSYDARVGACIFPKLAGKDSIRPIVDQVIIASGETQLIDTREHFTLPMWIEANICPPWSIGQKGLFIAHGPMIDPGWQGRLRVNVFNPTEHDIVISADEPFVTLRFEIQNIRGEEISTE